MTFVSSLEKREGKRFASMVTTNSEENSLLSLPLTSGSLIMTGLVQGSCGKKMNAILVVYPISCTRNDVKMINHNLIISSESIIALSDKSYEKSAKNV